MSTYTTKRYDRVDRICYDYYGTNANKIVEWVITQNPGLERQGILLEPGLTINLPDPPTIMVQPVKTIKQIILWS